MAIITTRAAKGMALTHNEVDDNFLNLNASLAVYDGAFQIVGTAMEVNYTFRLEDPTDNTKKAEFLMSGITTGTTRQYTLPNVSGTLAMLANTSQTFSGTTEFVPSTASALLTIGSTTGTGIITLGQSTATQTVDIARGATTAVSTKTVNIGTAGVSGSTTNINFGSAVAGSLVTYVWNAGGEKMRLASSGNLGIGTSAPAVELEVSSATGSATPVPTEIRISTATNASDWSTTLPWSRLSFYSADGSDGGAKIQGAVDMIADIAAGGRSSMVFSTSAPTTGTLTERMRIRTDGNIEIASGVANGVTYFNSSKVLTSGTALTFDGTNLGIGAASPFGKLNVANGAGKGFEFWPEIAASTNALFNFDRTGGTYQDFQVRAATHQWLIGAAEKMRLDSSGNLGLGVTPSAWNSATKAMQISTAATFWGLSNNQAYVGSNSFYDTAGNFKYIVTDNATQYRQWQGAHAWYNAPSGTAGAAITFTQAMTLDASGNLLVGTTSVVDAGKVSILFDNSSTNGISIKMSSTTYNNNLLSFRNSSNTQVGYVYSNGTTTSYGTSSDYRLKNITGPITTSGAYIDSLKPVEGTWKADGSTFVGLIAHETQEASRTTVATGTKDGDEMQGMDYSSAEIIANLIAELQSLRARVAQLESK